MDAKLNDLKEKQDVMEGKINELREMNRNREEELKQIKETIVECKNKVKNLKDKTGPIPSSTPSSPYGLTGARISNGEPTTSCCTWKLLDSRNLKLLAAAVFLHYTLSHSGCVLPYLSGFLSIIYAVITIYHFVLVTGLPLLRGFILKKSLDECTFQKVDKLFKPWYHLIGFISSGMAIQILQMTRCSGWSISNCIQMITRVGCFVIEVTVFNFPEIETLDDSSEISSINKLMAILLGTNVLTLSF